MQELLLKLVSEYPTAFPLVILIVGCLAVWHMSMTYSTFNYMKESMVTKQDLEIALLRNSMEMDKRYVQLKDCDEVDR